MSKVCLDLHQTGKQIRDTRKELLERFKVLAAKSVKVAKQ